MRSKPIPRHRNCRYVPLSPENILQELVGVNNKTANPVKKTESKNHIHYILKKVCFTLIVGTSTQPISYKGEEIGTKCNSSACQSPFQCSKPEIEAPLRRSGCESRGALQHDSTFRIHSACDRATFSPSFHNCTAIVAMAAPPSLHQGLGTPVPLPLHFPSHCCLVAEADAPRSSVAKFYTHPGS